MSIRLITFDLDRTLWDPYQALKRAEQAMYDWLCQQLPQLASLYSLEELVQYRINMAKSRPQLAWQVSALRKHVLRLILLQLAVPEQQQDELVEEAFMVFFRERSNLELFAGTEQVLKRLSADYSLIALTNGNASLRLAGIDHWFDAYFNAENVGAPKPQADMFQAALQHAKVASHEAIHVGDSIEMDVLAAKKLGFKTVWANYQHQLWPHDILPDAVITDIQQLPEAVANLQ